MLRPGHGHVQQTQLLRPELLPQTEGHRVPDDGGVPDHPRPVGALGAEAQRVVEQNGGPGVRLVELPLQPAQKHHREFQPLGLVDGQNAHPPPGGGGNRHGKVVFHHAGQVGEEAEQALVARALEPAGAVVQGQQIRPSAFPIGHGGEYRQQVGAAVGLPQQTVAALLGGQRPQIGQQGEETHAVMLSPLRPGPDAIVHRALRPGPQLRQPVRGEVEQR